MSAPDQMVMHAASPGDGGIWATDTLCGAKSGWRGHIASDVSCPDCLFLMAAEASL